LSILTTEACISRTEWRLLICPIFHSW